LKTLASILTQMSCFCLFSVPN